MFCKDKNLFALILLLPGALLLSAPQKKNSYQDFLKGLDLYSVPPNVTKVMKRRELHQNVIKRSPVFRQAKYDFATAREIYELAYYNAYYPKPTLGLSYSLNKTSATSSSNTTTLGFSLGSTTPWGLTYSVDFPKFTLANSATLDSGTGETTNSPSATSNIGFSLSYPLLRGSWFFLGTRTYLDADVAFDAAKMAQRQSLATALLSAEAAFYDVLLKQIRVQVLQASVASSKALKNEVQEMIRVGESDRISLLKVDLQIAQAETDLLVGQNDLESAKQILKEIIDYNELGEVFPDPSEIREAPAVPDISVEEAIKKAKKLRGDWLGGVASRKRAELDLQTAKNNLLPSLNLGATFGYTGTEATLGEAFSEMTRFNPAQYSVSLTLSYPFFNETDFSAHRQAKIRLHKADLSLKQLENQIIKEVNTALQSLIIGNRRLKMSSLSRELAEQRLRSEFEKFKVGESNIRNITDFQRELDNARIAELTARIDLLKQVGQFRNAIGELPEGIEL